MRLLVAAAGVAALALPGQGWAQAYRCIVPETLPRPRPDTASASQPQRIRPIGGYTLALTWAPQYCRDNARDASARFECGGGAGNGGGGNRFGFTLHGLWPDGVGREWPQYCTATALLPPAVIREHVCTTPSPQLLQHEWAKHGTCMQTTPAGYFRRSAGLYARLRYPDMDALSRRPLNAGQFAQALARANPGLPATAVRVTTTRRGWLDEVWLCLDKSFAYARCAPGTGGVARATALKIWRGRR